MSRKLALPLAFALALTAAACGDDDDTTTDTPDNGDEVASCEAGSLPVKEDGALTVATGEPAFEPWMVDDDPTNGEGFEAARRLRRRRGARLRRGRRHLGPHRLRRGHRPGREGLRLQRPAVLASPPSATRSSTSPTATTRSSRRSWRRADGDIASATSIADLKDATPRRRHRHHLPRLHRGGHPARHPAAGLRRQRRRQGRLRRQPGRRHRLRPPDGVLHHRRRDPRLGDRRRPAPRRGRRGARVPLRGRQRRSSTCVNEALATLEEDGTLAELQEQWLNQGGDIPTWSSPVTAPDVRPVGPGAGGSAGSGATRRRAPGPR